MLDWNFALIVALTFECGGGLAAENVTRPPWRMRDGGGARTFETAVDAEEDTAFVAAVAVRYPLYVKVKAEVGTVLEASLYQRLISDELRYSASLVLVRPLRSSQQLPVGASLFGTDGMLEDQFGWPQGLKANNTTAVSAAYQVFHPGDAIVIVADPVLLRGGAALVKASVEVQTAGWHWWVAVDLAHTTRHCQRSTRLSDACSNPVAMWTDSSNWTGLDPAQQVTQLLMLPVLAWQAHRWEGISPALLLCPVIATLLVTFSCLWRLTLDWQKRMQTLFDDAMVADALLVTSFGMYCASATHRIVIAISFAARGALPAGDFVIAVLLALAIVILGCFSLRCWVHLRCYTQPIRTGSFDPEDEEEETPQEAGCLALRRRAVLFAASAAASFCVGAGFFVGPAFGTIAACLPLRCLQKSLPSCSCGLSGLSSFSVFGDAEYVEDPEKRGRPQPQEVALDLPQILDRPRSPSGQPPHPTRAPHPLCLRAMMEPQPPHVVPPAFELPSAVRKKVPFVPSRPEVRYGVAAKKLTIEAWNNNIAGEQLQLAAVGKRRRHPQGELHRAATVGKVDRGSNGRPQVAESLPSTPTSQSGALGLNLSERRSET